MLAKINGLFRLTRDLDLKYSASGSAVAKLGLACSEKFGDKETQLFLDAVAFGKPAEILNQYASAKGTQIFLTGKLQTDTWEKEGVKQYKISMVVEGFDFVSNGQKQSSQENRGVNAPVYNEKIPQNNIPEIDINMDEIPF